MLRSDATAIAPTQPTAAAQPVRASSTYVGGTGGFGGLIGDVRADVVDFIQNGSTDMAAAAPATEAAADALPPALASLSPSAQGYRDATQGTSVAPPEQQAFLDAIAPYAEETGARLGVAPEIVAAHAALESGWGRKPLRQSDGGDTNNLFGVKAGAAWQGSTVDATTTEYDGGGAVKKVERFRSYADPAGAFHDYTQLLLDNPRYRSVLNVGSDARAFAQGLARGGYATDPGYADKLVRLATRLQSQ